MIRYYITNTFIYFINSSESFATFDYCEYKITCVYINTESSISPNRTKLGIKNGFFDVWFYNP